MGIKKSFIVWDESSKYPTQKMFSFSCLPSSSPYLCNQIWKEMEKTIIGGKHHRGVSLALLHILLSALSRTCWVGSLCTSPQTASLRSSSEKYCPTQRLGWFSSHALPLLLCCNLHTCYSFIHCNDWLSVVAKNMDFGVRLPRFKFHLLHLLFVWP